MRTMKFQRAFLISAAALFILSGCTCSGCASVIDSGGGGRKVDGGQLLPDGGAGAGEGGGGGGGNSDGGDGTTVVNIGPGSFVLDGGTTSSGEGVKLDDAGYIVLNQNDVQLYFMWIANNSAGTVSKFDTRNGKEVGRYYAAFPLNGQNQPNGISVAPVTQWSPSRTAIDLYGDVWIANRSPGIQGTVTKVANAINDCKDRNGNGVIDTSKDLNNDGAIDPATEMITPADWTNPAQYDECMLFTQPVGGAGGDIGARAVAISSSIEGGAGSVWVGIFRESRFYKLRATDGVPQPVNAAGNMFVQMGWGAYGAAIDGKQRLWAVVPGQAHLGLIDTTTGTLISDQIKPPAGHPSMGSYGIGIDGKDRVWLPGWGAGPKVSRYDHGPGVGAAVGTWTAFDFSSATSQVATEFGAGRGIAADDQGYVWMSASHTRNFGGIVAQLIGFDQETGAIKRPSGGGDFIDATDSATGNSIGVGLDGDGQPWINNGSGNAMKIDRNTGAITRTASQAGSLYTYSDFTGYQLRKFTAPRGTYRHDFTGCGPNTDWTVLEFTTTTPTGTSIEAFIKVANSVAELNAQTTPRYGPFQNSPVNLSAVGVPRGPYARVEFVLKSLDGQTTPTLKAFTLKSGCGFN